MCRGFTLWRIRSNDESGIPWTRHKSALKPVPHIDISIWMGGISWASRSHLARSARCAVIWSIRGSAATARLLIIAVLLAISTAGCGPLNKGIVEPAVDNAEHLLDNTIAQVAASMSTWQSSLTDLQDRVKDLTDDTASLIKTEAQQLAERSVAAVGTEFRCNVDFLGQRVLEGLNAIKSKVGGLTISPSPKFCSFSPGVVDMTLQPERRNRIEITGYNFDAVPRMGLIMTTASGATDVSKYLTVSTHYKATINMGGANPDQGLQLDGSARQLQLVWALDGQTPQGFTPQVTVIQPPPLPRCEMKNISTSPTNQYTVQAVHTGEGDKEIFGKGDVTIRVYRGGDDQVVTAKVYFRVRQYDDDHSTGQVTSPPIELFRAPPGTRIVAVAAATEEGPDVFRDNDWETDYIAGGGGLVREYVVNAEGPGEDLNGYAQVTVYFNAFNVGVIPSTGCVQ